MRFFVKAVATGFALSMGGALFKEFSKKIGLGEEPGSTSDDLSKKMSDSDLDGELDVDAPSMHN